MCVARPNSCGWWDTWSVRARGGFTIIEVMLTVAILALIAGLILPTFTSWRREVAFDAGKTSLADSITRCASLSQRDGIARVLVAETTASGTTRLIVQQLRATEAQGAAREVGGDASGDEGVPKGTALVELGVGLAIVSGEASDAKNSDNKSKGDAGEGPVQIALCVAMPDGMIRRSSSAIRLTQSDGTASVTTSVTPGGASVMSQGTSQVTTGLLRSSVMSIDEFTGRVSWREEEINKTEGAPASKPESNTEIKGEGGNAP